MDRLCLRMRLIMLTTVALASPAVGQIVSWNASSGLLPFDASIPADQRFAFGGNPSFVSMQDGFMNINETSTTFTVAISKTDIVPIDASDAWAFEIELRTNSHDRPVFDVGASTGIDGGGKRAFLLIARDAIGFGDLGGVDAWQEGGVHFMDTTDSFHVYRVIKSEGLVRVFVDNSTTPVVTLSHADFTPVESTKIWLAQTSNPGVADFDIRRFVVNPNGTNLDPSIPVASVWGLVTMTLLTLTAGTLVLWRKRIRSTS